jgi:hypothetical protein
MEKRPILVQKNLELTRWYFDQDGKTIELLFVDGNLQQTIPQFGESTVPTTVPPSVVPPGVLGTIARPASDDPAR